MVSGRPACKRTSTTKARGEKRRMQEPRKYRAVGGHARRLARARVNAGISAGLGACLMLGAALGTARAEVQLQIHSLDSQALELRYTPEPGTRVLRLKKTAEAGQAPLRASWQALDACSQLIKDQEIRLTGPDF